jgi:hypothetical protein
MRKLRMLVFLIPLGLIVSGFLLKNALPVIIGLFSVIFALQFTQLARWKDPEQRELYLPTYKKEWEGKEKRR